MKNIKIVALFSILLCLLVIVPAAFASENVTSEDNNLTADYYFDSNIENDTGDGSITHPYRNFNSSNVKDNSVVHFANGEYDLGYVSKRNLTVVGQDPSKTVLTYGRFDVSSSLTLKNVTLNTISISNSGTITAQNTIFSNSSSTSGGVISSKSANSAITLNNCTFIHNSATEKGGAISSNGANSVVTLNNCTFIHNSATEKGGAIWMNGGNLNINDSIFEDNYAQGFGGSIASEKNAVITIMKSKFLNGGSQKDAGGAIYLINSNLTANNLEVINCTATFGGAITSLNTYLNLTTFKGRNNRASYNGGALYAMYAELYLSKSTFDNNSASNGAALFVDEVYDFVPSNNKFTNNRASDVAGAVYSIISDSLDPFSVLDKSFKNTFSNNHASVNDDVYETNLPDMDIGGRDYILIKYKSSFNGTLPSSYDLRQLGQVTSVKNQGNGGNCWAFAALASLESCILKATGKSFDLSEENMKNLMSKYSDYGWAMETNTGGYDKMGIGYLVSWLGPVNESDDEYSGQSTLSPVIDSFIHVQNIITFKRSNYTDNDEIKKAIIDYGAVSTSICWKTSPYLKGNNYYCYNATESANHAVVIVGWDDNYSKGNFKTAPPGNGAWIIKNSWGTSSGDKGYYYVSYYDTKLAPLNKPESTFTFILNDTVRYDKNYQYDIQGKTDYFLNSSSIVWYKNKFTATSNEYLAAVSTYFEKNTDWDLSIYVNDVLKQTKSGSSHSGYYTIDLRNLIPLKIGDVFEVVFKISVDGEAAFPISERVSLNREFYAENISYLSYDGVNWVDIYELKWVYPSHTYNSQVACIKAFTVSDKLASSITLKVNNNYNPCEITAYVTDQYGLPISTGKVKFSVDGQTITSNVVDGYAKLFYFFDNLNANSISATFTNAGYKSSSTKYVVNAKNSSIAADDLTVYYGKNINYAVKLVDASGNPVSGKNIKFNVNDVDYIVKTNSKGIATIKPKLGTGNYSVAISFADCYNNDHKITKRIMVKSTIILPTATKYTLNSKYAATLLDADGNPLKNTKVSIKIGKNSYSEYTDSSGKVSLNIDLAPASYTVSITNANNEVKTQNIKVIARISNNNNLTMYSSANQSYTVKAYDDYGGVAKGLNVSFKVNGNTYWGYTDEKGFASIDLCLQPGTYDITSSYKGYEASNVITVKTTINLPSVAKYTYNSEYVFTVLDDNGNPLKNSMVSFKVGDNTYNKYSDDSGKVSLKINLNPGSYLVSVTNGNEVKTQKITVAKRLDCNSAITMYYGAGKSYKVKAHDDYGNAIKNAKITFKVNGHTYYGYTNSYGNAYLKINLNPGSYKITATYKGYKVSNKIVVKPTLVMSAKTVKRYKTFKYNVKLLDKNGKILKYKKVTVKFRGKTYKVKTNSKGIATFKIKAFSKTGKFTLTASYGSAKISKKITVKK